MSSKVCVVQTPYDVARIIWTTVKGRVKQTVTDYELLSFGGLFILFGRQRNFAASPYRKITSLLASDKSC